MMSTDPDRDVDDAWDDLDAVTQAAPISPSSHAADLGELDGGWDFDDAAAAPVPGEHTRGKRAQVRALTKKERRDLERQKRLQAAQQAAARKREQKQQRQERARRKSEQRRLEQSARVAAPAQRPTRAAPVPEPETPSLPKKQAAPVERARADKPATAARAVARPARRSQKLGVVRALVGLVAAVILVFVAISLFQR